ncbi:hypothetical protein IFM58399_04518 [Aspergillus lentulus]|nr:uncharacterized protein IFM58399_04518 [Aspergillus lentulus]GFF36340.1 hypothetical protein IFM58399_04518 [Aspergillus lentulus]GFF63383.1 hypothetical protein IFM62136_05627 [Aspergillus lentulus]GFF82453.1 hypothetical protein IFM47457_05815 [Aspergillus lentulus]
MPFTSLVEPVSQRPNIQWIESRKCFLYARIRDQLSIVDWLSFGAVGQTVLLLLLGRIALAPLVIYLFLQIMGATLHSIGIGRNQYMEGVIPQPVSSQMPSSTGVFEQPSSRDVVVLLLGTRVNHPLGVLAPGAVKMAKYFGAMMTELNENASQYCLLGASNGWLEADRETHNNIMTVFYFENIEGLHKFAHGPLHREAVKWYHSTVKDYPHLSIWHETFHSPAGHWETVYGGSAPTLMGRTTYRVEMEGRSGEKEMKWLNPLVDASRGLLKSASGRLGRLQRSRQELAHQNSKYTL